MHEVLPSAYYNMASTYTGRGKSSEVVDIGVKPSEYVDPVLGLGSVCISQLRVSKYSQI